jgi:hypothetical protein
MAFSWHSRDGGDPIAYVVGGSMGGKILYALSRPAEGLSREVVLDGGEFVPVPDIRQDSASLSPSARVCCTGATRCGKTTWAARYLKEAQRLWPEKPIYLFSSHNNTGDFSDSAFNGVHGMHRVMLNRDLLSRENPLSPEFLRGERDEEGVFPGAICVFDDIDGLAATDKAVGDWIISFRNRLLVEGRHYGITVITTQHEISMGQKYRACLSEVSNLIVFPGTGSDSAIIDYCKRKCHFSPAVIERILHPRGGSRWVSIGRIAPVTVLGAREAWFL